MRKKLSILALSIAIWWISINFNWVQVGEKSFTGAALSPALNLLPAIALLMLFISIYGRLVRLLLLLISGFSAYGAAASLTTTWLAAPAISAEFERLTGIAGGDHTQLGISAELTLWPQFSGALALITAAVALWILLTGRRASTQSKNSETPEEVLDNRALWDQQEN